MGANASRVAANFDVSAAVTLKALAAVAVTTTETAISLNELDTAYWHNGEIPHGKMVVVFHITACVANDGDETYVLSLQVDDTLAQSDSPVTIDSFTWVRGTTGVITRVIDSKDIPVLDADSSAADKWMAVKATLGGTTPSITYGCWIAHSLGG